MKITHLTLAAVLAVSLPLTASLEAGQRAQDRDLAAVMKVVKRPGQTAQSSSSSRSASSRSKNARNRYLSLEVGGQHSTDALKITVPLSLVELLLSYDEEATLTDVGGDSDVKLKEVIKTLRDLDPGELLEIRSHEGWLRVWLE